jgi:hypothetical protein
MDLQAAKDKSPQKRALLAIDDREFVTVDESLLGPPSIHLYERIGNTPRYRVRSIEWSELDEIRNFADHSRGWVDTRASESTRWFPLGSDVSTIIPAWVVDTLRDDQGPQVNKETW